MSVYVDFLRPCVPNGQFRWTRSAHLFSENVDELHAMARRIGLKREWFQNESGKLPHYDLNPARWAKAIAAGCLFLPRKEAVAMWRKIKAANTLTPSIEQAPKPPTE